MAVRPRAMPRQGRRIARLRHRARPARWGKDIGRVVEPAVEMGSTTRSMTRDRQAGSRPSAARRDPRRGQAHSGRSDRVRPRASRGNIRPQSRRTVSDGVVLGSGAGCHHDAVQVRWRGAMRSICSASIGRPRIGFNTLPGRRRDVIRACKMAMTLIVPPPCVRAPAGPRRHARRPGDSAHAARSRA